MFSYTLIIAALFAEGRFFSSFSILKDIEVASILMETRSGQWSWSISSFSKNDKFLQRRVRELTLNAKREVPTRFGVLGLGIGGQLDIDNAVEQRLLRMDLNLNGNPAKWLTVNHSSALELLKLIREDGVMDNSGFAISENIVASKGIWNLTLEGAAEHRPILKKTKKSVSVSFNHHQSGLSGEFGWENAYFHYEIAGGVNDETHNFKKGSISWQSQLDLGRLSIDVNFYDKTIDFADDPIRNRKEQAWKFMGQFAAPKELALPLDLTFAHGVTRRSYPNAEVVEVDTTRSIGIGFNMDFMTLGYTVELQRITFPKGRSADDNDERKIEAYVESTERPLSRTLKVKIRMGVKQNDFVFVKSERSANTRQRKTFILDVNLKKTGQIKIQSRYRLSAHYIRYKFAPNKDFMLREFRIDTKIGRNVSKHLEISLDFRMKFSDRGPISKDFYHRQRFTKEYWITPDLLIKTGIGLNFKFQSYGYFRKVYENLDFEERSLKLGIVGEYFELEFSLNKRNGLNFHTFSFQYKRGF